MTVLLGRTPHTLAQFARRAGISEGRLRVLKGTAALPPPDSRDADGKPLWWAATIDAWCGRTGRAVSENSLWMLRVSPAAEPAAEVERGRQILVWPATGGTIEVFAIVWDTPQGHVIYLQHLGDDPMYDALAPLAAQLIDQRWWSTAVVLIPISRPLAHADFDGTAPTLWTYLLEANGGEDRGMSSRERWLRRSLASPEDEPEVEVEAVFAGHMDAADVARALGHRIPIWLADTATRENVDRALAYDRTFTVPDTTTPWPAAEQDLAAAVKAGLPGDFPGAFAALCVETRRLLDEVVAQHAKVPDAGDGWYFVCRPARPAPPVELERYLTGAVEVPAAAAVAELPELRALEGDLDVADPRCVPYWAAVEALRSYLRWHGTRFHQAVLGVEEGTITHPSPWVGPVVDSWRQTLTEVDTAEALRKRRVERMLNGGDPAQVVSAYRDPDGRYVLVCERRREQFALAEWPVGLDVTRTWTEKTILAADRRQHGGTTLLALTPTEDGQMRVDPVPLEPHGDREDFAYGYWGGTPATTYVSIARCALGEQRFAEIESLYSFIGSGHHSELWDAIATTQGPLRLSWPQVQLWARADRKNALAARTS